MSNHSRLALSGFAVALFSCGPAVSDDPASSSTSETTSSPGTSTSISTSASPPLPSTTAPNTSTTAGPQPTDATGSDNGSNTGSDTGDSTLSGDDTGNSFLLDPDMHIAPDGCWVWGSDCFRGEKCIAWGTNGDGVWNATRCTDVGPDQVGDPCVIEGSAASGFDSCALGSMCWGVDPDTNMGTCAALCLGSESNPVCTDPTQSCMIANNGVLNLCLPTCDPLQPLECADDEACYAIGPPPTTVCLPPQTPVSNDGLYPAFCSPGSTAIEPELSAICDEGEQCCAPWCDLSEPDCDVGLECFPLIPEGGGLGVDDRGFCVELP